MFSLKVRTFLSGNCNDERRIGSHTMCTYFNNKNCKCAKNFPKVTKLFKHKLTFKTEGAASQISSYFCSFKFIIHSSPTEQKCTSLHWRIQGPHCSVWRRGETVVGLFAQMHHECVMVFKNFFSALCVFSWLNLRTWSPSIRWPSRTSTASSPRQSWTKSNTHTGPISPLQSCNFITWHWPHNKDYVF